MAVEMVLLDLVQDLLEQMVKAAEAAEWALRSTKWCRGSGVVIVQAPAAATLTVSPGTNTTSTAPSGAKVATFTVSGH